MAVQEIEQKTEEEIKTMKKNYKAWEVMMLTDEEKDEWIKKIEEKHGFDILIHNYYEGWYIEWYEPIEA